MVLASRSNRCLRTGSEENCAGENLDRYGAFQPRIPGPVHFAHSACTELRLTLIGPEFCPRRQRHIWPRLYSQRNLPELSGLMRYVQERCARRSPVVPIRQLPNRRQPFPYPIADELLIMHGRWEREAFECLL